MHPLVFLAIADDIHGACGRKGDLGALRAYIAAAKDVNVTNGQGQTPLHMAALFGRDGIAEALLAAGADPISLKKGIEKAVKAVTDELLAGAKEVESKEQIAATASISAADSEIGALIAEAIDKVGKEGVVTVEESTLTPL